jgi:bacterial/archaeal transporter family-2 protein
MLAAGIGIPILAALNASLGQRIGSPATAAFCLFLVALAGTAAVLLATGSAFRTLPGQPRHLFLAGLLVAFYVLSITWIAPRFGVGNAVFFVLLGQLIAAAADRPLRPLRRPRSRRSRPLERRVSRSWPQESSSRKRP